MNYSFKKDLPIAEETEKEVAGMLSKIYNAQIVEFGKTNKYDILAKIGDNYFTFEVKEDFLCERTGNVGLEFSCRGKPSGIETTEADYYIYKIHTKNGIVFILHNTANIKEMISKNRYFRIVNGGDPGSDSLNYLFKYEEFIKTGRQLTLDKLS